MKSIKKKCFFFTSDDKGVSYQWYTSIFNIINSKVQLTLKVEFSRKIKNIKIILFMYYIISLLHFLYE